MKGEVKMADVKDDFWDIDKLVPKREKPRYVRPERDVSAVEITVDAGSQNAAPTTVVSRVIPQRASEPADTDAPEEEYKPESPLISSVRIFRWRNSYNYYEQFCLDAERVAQILPQPCERVPYFSYVPQYVQLSSAQLRWYVYWRSRVFAGEYPSTDYSYILLLIFEIINRAEKADVKEGQRVLCELWIHYREEFPRLDRYLCEWICDYSLIHRLPPPIGFIDLGIAEYSTLREFYVYYDKNDNLGYARALIRFCSAYDYHKSKFAKGEGLALFDLHVPSSLAYVLEKCSEPGHILSAAGLEDNRITRDSYSGALCASAIKRRIEVSFFSFSRSHELRFLIADIIKYSENKIRAAMGVKSRLGVYSVPDAIRASLDEYFLVALPRYPKAIKEAEPKEEYEKLYEAPATELSIENAAKIEDSSWRVTQMLVEAFEEEREEIKEVVPEPIKEETEEEDTKAAFRKELGEKFDLIIASLKGDANEQKNIASRLGLMIDLLADEINDAAANILGDIILEDCGGYYTIIEDYREIFENE